MINSQNKKCIYSFVLPAFSMESLQMNCSITSEYYTLAGIHQPSLRITWTLASAKAEYK